MNGVTQIAWSADGSMLAFDSGTELKIVHVPDGRVVMAADVFYGNPKRDLSKDRYGDFYRFGPMAFSEDGKMLIFQNGIPQKLERGAPPDWVPTILLKLDIATGKIVPLLKSPLGIRRTDLETLLFVSGFRRLGDRLFYSAPMSRPDEIIRSGSRIVNNVEYGNFAIPTTVYVCEFGPSGQIVSIRSVEFPKPGEEVLDQSRDIFDVWYSAPGDMLIVGRRQPYHFDAEPPQDPSRRRNFLETVHVGNGKHAAFIGNDPNMESLWFDDCEPHPTQPWCVTRTSDTRVAMAYRRWQKGDRQHLMLWELRDGRLIADSIFFPDWPQTDPSFSPDGSRFAMVDGSGVKIPVFKIVSNKGGAAP